MAGPTKPWDEDKVGTQVQYYYEFLEKLYGTGGQALRDALFSRPNEEELRLALRAEDIDVDEDVRIMLVDIENARTKCYPPAIKPGRDKFYVLVLPPKLRRETKDPKKRDYLEMQAWAGAWYHAMSDGYGM